MTVVSSFRFLGFAIIHMGSAVIMAKRISTASQDNHLMTWKACHWVLFVALVFVILDCIRLGLGGFWEDTTLENPPAFAFLYCLAVIIYLLLVPLLIFYQAELVIATKWVTTEAVAELEDTARDVRLRRASLLISAVLSCLLFFNLYAQFMAYLAEGYTRTEENGVVKYKWPSTERAQELGYIILLPDRVGVAVFAVSAMVAGGVIWCRTGWPWYFFTAFLGIIMGQGVGTAFPPWFFFRTTTFAGQVMAGGYLFKRKNEAVETELWQGS